LAAKAKQLNIYLHYLSSFDIHLAVFCWWNFTNSISIAQGNTSSPQITISIGDLLQSYRTTAQRCRKTVTAAAEPQVIVSRRPPDQHRVLTWDARYHW